MANHPGSDGFRVEPATIASLRQAFQSAIQQLQPALRDADNLRIRTPAMADQASIDFQTAFNTAADGGPDSAVQSLKAFEQRLHGAVQQLDAIAQAYGHTEQNNAEHLHTHLES
jgi:hypothetical protein